MSSFRYLPAHAPVSLHFCSTPGSTWVPLCWFMGARAHKAGFTGACAAPPKEQSGNKGEPKVGRKEESKMERYGRTSGTLVIFCFHFAHTLLAHCVAGTLLIIPRGASRFCVYLEGNFASQLCPTCYGSTGTPKPNLERHDFSPPSLSLSRRARRAGAVSTPR